MTNDKPPVAPIEGHYAMLRNGDIHRIGKIEGLPDFSKSWGSLSGSTPWWYNDGSVLKDRQHEYDIIATISPSQMQWAASPPQITGREIMMLQDAAKAGVKASGIMDRLARLEALLPLADAVLDHADSHCRWFDISTAPKDGTFILVRVKDDAEHWGGRVFASRFLSDDDVALFPGRGAGPDDLTHWALLPPPPSNPPLPAVFAQLGQALEKIKGAG